MGFAELDFTEYAGLDALLIAGPTASGKSALAVQAAKVLRGEVVNADSMQVYSGLELLSARPTAAEMAGVPHHLYGFVPPERAYSVGDYLRDAAPVLADLKGRGKPAIIVGGTGLYFRALTEGLVETPAVPAEIRGRLEAEAAAGADMHRRLMAVDSAAAARLSPADTPRILRALEVIEATGEPLATWQARGQGTSLLAPGRWRGLFLNPDRAALFERIDARFVAMIAAGALDEVQALAARQLPANRGIMKAHGVPHLIAHLAGALPREQAIALGQQDTRRYAKRQVTWARKFMTGWTWLS
jgi:tRNA dimethylallyltransferase